MTLHRLMAAKKAAIFCCSVDNRALQWIVCGWGHITP